MVPMILEHGQLYGLDEYIHQRAHTDEFAMDWELGSHLEKLGGVYLEKRSYFCPNEVPCRAIMRDGGPIMYDEHHFTRDAAEAFGAYARKRYPELPRTLAKGRSPATAVTPAR